MTGRLLAFLALVACTAFGALTREQLVHAEPEVRRATVDLLADLARGETTRGEVAESVRIMASQTADPAEEYLFLQGAFRLFVRAGEYARAVDVLRRMQKREFPVEALVDLVGRALEPVPRGTDVGELEPLFRALRAEAAQVRAQRAERRVAAALARVRVAGFEVVAGETLPDVLGRVRRELANQGEAGFRYVLRCPLASNGGERFPALPALRLADVSLADVLARVCAAGALTMRARGGVRIFEVLSVGQPARAPVDFPGEDEETARRMKRVRIGFVAFGGDETVDQAVERVLQAVADDGRQSSGLAFDLVLWAPPDGRFPRTGTARASDTTLYDALGLACASAGYVLDVRGACVVLRPAPAGTVP